MDVVEAVEGVANPDPVEHAPGIWRITIGVDEFAPGQLRERRDQPLVAADPVERDVVDVVEEMMRIDVMLLHQPRKRGAMFVKVRFLDALGLDRVDAEQARDVSAHALVDQREQPGARGVEAVIEIEDPRVDVREGRGKGHGVALTD